MQKNNLIPLLYKNCWAYSMGCLVSHISVQSLIIETYNSRKCLDSQGKATWPENIYSRSRDFSLLHFSFAWNTCVQLLYERTVHFPLNNNNNNNNEMKIQWQRRRGGQRVFNKIRRMTHTRHRNNTFIDYRTNNQTHTGEFEKRLILRTTFVYIARNATNAIRIILKCQPHIESWAMQQVRISVVVNTGPRARNYFDRVLICAG